MRCERRQEVRRCSELCDWQGGAEVYRGVSGGQVMLASGLAQQAAKAYTAAAADTPDGLKLLWQRISAKGEGAEDTPSATEPHYQSAQALASIGPDERDPFHTCCGFT